MTRDQGMEPGLDSRFGFEFEADPSYQSSAPRAGPGFAFSRSPGPATIEVRGDGAHSSSISSNLGMRETQGNPSLI